jgi:hypothetical protein
MIQSIFLSAKRQMSTKRWLRLREMEAYFRVPVWALGHKGRWNDCYLPLHRNFVRLWKTSGPSFLVSYLKECTRITVYWVSGTKYAVLANGVRVARARSGLPLILPAQLRYLISRYRTKGETAGWIAMRITLTLFSVYRVIGCRPVLKLGTITDPFSGTATTLPEEEVRQAITLLGGTLVLKPARPDLFSEAAGPNFPRATWSSGLDCLAFLYHPRVWLAWITISVSSRS